MTKATVTITFDNHDKKQSPLGYDSYDEIVVSRQVKGRHTFVCVCVCYDFSLSPRLLLGDATSI